MMKTFTKLAVASAMAILPISAFAQASGANGAPAGSAAGQATAPAKTDLSVPPAAMGGSATQGAATQTMPGMTGGKMDMSAPAATANTSAAAGKTEMPAKTAAGGKTHAATARKSHVKVMKVNHKATAPTGVQVKTPDASKS